MANFFDQFDVAPASSASLRPGPRGKEAPPGNFFDQFDDEQTNADWNLKDALATPEGQALEGQLKDEAARQLLSRTPGADSPLYAGVSAAGNAAFLNLPRNILAGARAVSSGQPFSDEYERLKEIDEASARLHPVASDVGTGAGLVGGAFAVPAAPAASLVGRAVQGAAIGAGYGGLSEFADSKDFGQAAQAAGAGAALGGVAPPLVEGFARGAGAVGRGVSSSVRGVANPEAEAANRVSRALQRDAAIGGQQLDDAAMTAAQQRGQPVVVGDMGGKATQSLARSAANTSPEARHALESITQDRFESQAPRVSEFVMGLGTGNEALTTREALQTASAKANRPAYAKAYAEGRAGSWHEGLAQLAQAPVVADAIKGATRTGANKAAAEGFRPVKNPFVTLESGEIALHDPNVKPTLQFWDAVKRNLDDKIGSLQRGGENSAARDAIELRRQLVTYLDQDFPAYADARQGAAKFFGAQDALEAGEKFVTASGKNSEYARAIAKMSDPERKLFADGFASRLSARINESGDRRSVLNSIFNSPAARQRVQMALGTDKAKEFEAFMRIEGLMDGLRTVVKGNSSTVRQLVEAGLAGGALGQLSSDNFSAGAMLGALARGGKIKIDQRIAQRVGEMLSSSDPEVFRKAIRMAAKNPLIMEVIKKAEVYAGAAATPYAEEPIRRGTGQGI